MDIEFHRGFLVGMQQSIRALQDAKTAYRSEAIAILQLGTHSEPQDNERSKGIVAGYQVALKKLHSSKTEKFNVGAVKVHLEKEIRKAIDAYHVEVPVQR